MKSAVQQVLTYPSRNFRREHHGRPPPGLLRARRAARMARIISVTLMKGPAS